MSIWSFIGLAVLAVAILFFRKHAKAQAEAFRLEHGPLTAAERDALIRRIEACPTTGGRVPLAGGAVTGCIGGNILIWRNTENVAYIVCHDYVDRLARKVLSTRRSQRQSPSGRFIQAIDSAYDSFGRSLSRLLLARNRTMTTTGRTVEAMLSYRSPGAAKCEMPCCVNRP